MPPYEGPPYDAAKDFEWDRMNDHHCYACGQDFKPGDERVKLWLNAMVCRQVVRKYMLAHPACAEDYAARYEGASLDEVV